MAKTTACEKKMLEERGVWKEFVRHRSGLKLSGMSAVASNKEALAKYLGDDYEGEAPEEEKGNKGIRKPESNTDASVISSIPPPPAPVSRSAFDGKPEVGEIENIIWVCDNMRIVDVSPEECPSLRAWNLLCECRESGYFRQGFWKDHYGKTVPAKSTLDDGGGRKGFDGQVTMELLDRIDAAAELSKKEAEDEMG